jgi:OOP family OmpA-OmpF porin
VSLSAHPTAIAKGECAALTWSSTNAARLWIDFGVGAADQRGSRPVCPERTTQYTIAALGAGGSDVASATVVVTDPPAAPTRTAPAITIEAPPPGAVVVDHLTLHVNFDFDKASIRSGDTAELQKAIEFAAKYPAYRKSVIGHTDNIGSERYNQGLSEKRAAAVKAHLVQHGVADGERITTAGFGHSRPVADNATEAGRFENRRVEILILAE